MSSMEVSSVCWFVSFMRLHNRGVTPTVTPTEFMPSRPDLAEYWGQRSGRGFVFQNQDIPEYEIYVRELFSRVYQLPWPLGGVLPFHFARGLMVEALSYEVNWADFAYIVTHPHQSRTGIPRILPEYKALDAPLPVMARVMPQAHLSVRSNFSSLSVYVTFISFWSCSTPQVIGPVLQHDFV